MQRFMMTSKLHGVTVTQCNLDYMGSLTVDRNLMEVSGLIPNEAIQVVNLQSGARFNTYVIEGEAGSGIIGANGGAARLCVVGDRLLVIAYGLLSEAELATHEPKVILVGEGNQPLS